MLIQDFLQGVLPHGCLSHALAWELLSERATSGLLFVPNSNCAHYLIASGHPPADQGEGRVRSEQSDLVLKGQKSSHLKCSKPFRTKS